MTATWPTASSFPQMPEYQSFSQTPQRPITLFKPDIGASIRRRRSSLVMVPTRAMFLINAAQKTVWDSFFNDDIEAGALPFNWVHPISLVTYTWILDDADPQLDATNFDQYQLQLQMLQLP